MPVNKRAMAVAVDQWKLDNNVGVMPEGAATYQFTWRDLTDILTVPVIGAPVLLLGWAGAGTLGFLSVLAAEVAASYLYLNKHHTGWWLCKPEMPEPEATEEEKQEVAEVKRLGIHQLQSALAEFGIRAQVTAYDADGPRLTKFVLEPARDENGKPMNTVDFSEIQALGQRFIRTLNLPPDTTISVEENIGDGRGAVYLPKLNPTKVYLHKHLHYMDNWDDMNLPVLLGLGTDGAVVSMDMEQAVHTIVGGTSGSGKTISLLSMLLSLAYARSPDHVRFTLFDPKKVGLMFLNGLPHCRQNSITDMEQALRTANKLVELMDDRYATLARAGFADIKRYNKANPDAAMPYEIVVCEELSLMIKSSIPIYDDDGEPTKRTVGQEIELALVKLAAAGRGAGILILAATQRFAKKIFDGELADNLDTGICLKVSDHDASKMVIGQGGGQNLNDKGDALIRGAGYSSPKRLQMCFVDEDEHIPAIVQKVNERWAACDS